MARQASPASNALSKPATTRRPPAEATPVDVID